MRIRQYRADDRENCLALLDANTPRHFGPEERPEFAAYLAGSPAPFFVAESAGGLLACGGIEIFGNRGEAEFRWVMVSPAAQKGGLGRRLMLLSLDHLVRHTPIRDVLVHTSQTSAAFFSRLGFPTELMRVEEDYWTEGLDLHLLSLKLGADAAAVLARELEPYGGLLP
jgi:N-acetylglutamate synthase-like GNAT family acetyltransferase